MELAAIRSKIDQIDQEIVDRLNARVELASAVAKAKQKEGTPIYAPEREEQVFSKLKALNTGPLTEPSLRSIYREIISAMIGLERELSIAYLGPEATYTHQAALKNFGNSLNYCPMNTIADVFTAVERDEADYGVIPVENSTGGAVIDTLDRFLETDLKIVAQIYMKVEHCLVSNCNLKSIQRIYSKDQAFIQCRDWLARNLPHAEQVRVDSTVQAVERVRDEMDSAAVASELAAQLYGVPLQAQGIQDHSKNVTRFLVLGKQTSPVNAKTVYRTSILVAVKDESGALEKVLHPFSSRGISLAKIESRPNRDQPWEYVFFIDFIGNSEDTKVQAALKEVAESSSMLKELGSYPLSE